MSNIYDQQYSFKVLPDHGAAVAYNHETDTAHYGPIGRDETFHTEELAPTEPEDLRRMGMDRDRFNDLVTKFRNFLSQFRE